MGKKPGKSTGSQVPAQLEAKFQQALKLHQTGKLAQAKQLYEDIRVDLPDHFQLINMLGIVTMQSRSYADAISLFDRAIALNPGYAETYCNRGIAFKESGRFIEAAASFSQAIERKSDSAEAYYHRGNVMIELGRCDDALADFDKAAGLKPNDPLIYASRAIALTRLGELEAAVASYDQAISLRPDYAIAFSNRGIVLNKLNRHKDAIVSLDKAISLQPDYAAAYWNKALCLLVTGDFEHGLPFYEWRWRITAFARGRKNVAQPFWSGKESLSGKTILLYSEQGFGDAIQFCRYAALVAARGARVILEVQPALTRLFRDLDGVDAIVSRGEPLPAFDYHCPLLSLPLAFGTRLDTIPASAGYLHVDSDIRARWAERLGPAEKPRVGLVWSGSVTNTNDHNRSLAVDELLQNLPDNCHYISLQKEIRNEDKQALQLHPELLHFGDELHDFADTAALCDLMDIVISVDTSVAHLSGALGKPTWVLLPYSPDWRWLLERSDSPWYPAMTLYRQTAPGDWNPVISSIGEALAEAFPE